MMLHSGEMGNNLHVEMKTGRGEVTFYLVPDPSDQQPHRFSQSCFLAESVRFLGLTSPVINVVADGSRIMIKHMFKATFCFTKAL